MQTKSMPQNCSNSPKLIFVADDDLRQSYRNGTRENAYTISSRSPLIDTQKDLLVCILADVKQHLQRWELMDTLCHRAAEKVPGNVSARVLPAQGIYRQ